MLDKVLQIGEYKVGFKSNSDALMAVYKHLEETLPKQKTSYIPRTAIVIPAKRTAVTGELRGFTELAISLGTPGAYRALVGYLTTTRVQEGESTLGGYIYGYAYRLDISYALEMGTTGEITLKQAISGGTPIDYIPKRYYMLPDLGTADIRALALSCGNLPVHFIEHLLYSGRAVGDISKISTSSEEYKDFLKREGR